MSDFLANLAERTTMPDLVVRPKLLTPYELPATSLVGFEPVVERNDIDEAPANIPVSVSRNEHATERHPSRRQEVEAPALEKTPAPRISPDFEVLQPHPTVRTIEDDVKTGVASEGAGRARIKDSQPASPEAVQITKPARSIDTAAIGPYPRALLKLDRPSRRESKIAQHSDHLIHESQMDRGDNSLVAASPSSVTIRIGRVEVRAMTSPARAVDRRVSAHTIERPSLNDYLEQRSRGGKS